MPNRTDLAAARAIIAKGSKSFATASLLFPKALRLPVYLLYAWCRHCDDQIDGQELGFGRSALDAKERHRRLDLLFADTRAAMAGAPMRNPIMQGFQYTFQRYEIPERYPLDLLRGLEMDTRCRVYVTLEDTLEYCYHVAGVVGIMMAFVMGVRDLPTLHRAVDLGIAFQLTNISRDVMEDAAAGRVYLPQTWLQEASIPLQPATWWQHTGALHTAVDRLLNEAEHYYASALHGIARLPLRCAWAVATARGVYREIGRKVQARGPAAWDSRVTIGARKKSALLLSAGLATLSARWPGRGRTPPSREGLWTLPAERL